MAKNTLLIYQYRDASNYKQLNEALIEGEMTDEQFGHLLECCLDGESFIPSKVGLPETRFDRWDDDLDHCWFELQEYRLIDKDDSRHGKPMPDLTVSKLIAEFDRCRQNWEKVDPPINIANISVDGNTISADIIFPGEPPIPRHISITLSEPQCIAIANAMKEKR